MNISGVIRTDNLRDILLFEVDLKFSNKLYFGSRLTKIVEISGVLPQEQHSGRSGHTSIEVAVLIILFFDYTRPTIRNASLRLYDKEIAITM